MKTRKILLPLITTATLASSLPLVALTSCKDNKTEKLGNLMYEYTPTHKTFDKISLESPKKALETYLSEANKDPEIFIQDLRYTISRGMPQYISYVSEFCEITKNDFNMEIDKDDVNVDVTNKKVTFKATFHVYYDYSKTKKQEMIWYDMYYFIWNTYTTVEFVLDFDTFSDEGETPFLAYADGDYARKQMTTYAGATQFGLSEVGTTIKLISENGYYVDIETPEKHTVNVTEPSDPFHFMLPAQAYWTELGKLDTYYRNYEQVWNLWFNEPSLQCIALMLKYYMPSNTYITTSTTEVLPNTFDFGSYYMKDVTLNDTYAYTYQGEENQKTASLWGFNRSLDSINNYANIQREGQGYVDGVLTMPITANDGTTRITTIRPYAFNGDLSNYTNLGIPEEVQELVVPLSYDEIYTKAFASNGGLSEKYDYGFTKLTFKKSSSTVPIFQENAFHQLFEVDTIDFSSFADPTAYKMIHPTGQGNKWLNAFKEIHLILPVEAEKAEGIVILPKGVVKGDSNWNQWISVLAEAGLPQYNAVSKTAGWEFVIAE